jgi:hypothetical protein
MKSYWFVGQRPLIHPAQGIALVIGENNNPDSAQWANLSITPHWRTFGPLGRLCFPFYLPSPGRCPGLGGLQSLWDCKRLNNYLYRSSIKSSPLPKVEGEVLLELLRIGRRRRLSKNSFQAKIHYDRMMCMQRLVRDDIL